MPKGRLLLGKIPVLITGGMGMVGRLLLDDLHRDHQVRATGRSVPDLIKDAPPPGVDEFLQGDLRDPRFANRAVAGADAVIHLAANASPVSSVAEAMGNVEIAANVLDAAARAGVKNVVIASSVHASGLDYRDGISGISPAHPPRPCCPYGAGKVAVEGLARLHQDEMGNSVSCLRLGLVGWPLEEREYAHTWLSAGDMRALVRAALTARAGFGIYHGVSRDAATRWDTGNAREDLGWVPFDHWAKEVGELPLAKKSSCRLLK
ncbi:NAD(P)-dependent oxidoreductase [Arthrobacter sp. ISL-72]|uniref:NAD-dependent epimerase/dehydratase family protein n=1 Tax=Arthrobacter sp. ISL-72 TaxID=2819114 RepID=UPI001BE84EA4|nr:NAD(P)-dependent oxidoreductase [Arthrobacter sp. ISL-72]